jgi:hypothetical protein
MMAMALIDEIANRLLQQKQQAHTGVKEALTYFFCQGSVTGLNDAISVLRGLIYVLVKEQEGLRHHTTEHYNHQGRRLFDGDYGLHALWSLLLEISQDSLLNRLYLVIDALDECGHFQENLLQLLTRGASALPSKVKWIITSRNEPQIKQMLEDSTFVLDISLELNSQHVVSAVQAFIECKVDQLQKMNHYDDELRRQVDVYLRDNAEGTFLWVALVYKEIRKTSARKTLSALKRFPAGLEPLYERILQQIEKLEDKEDVECCRRILLAAVLAFRPLHLDEFAFVADLPNEFTGKPDYVQEVVELCGSFFTIREDMVFFVHQSVKDYLSGKSGQWIFPAGLLGAHKSLAHRLLTLMSAELKMDICDLRHPGALHEEIEPDLVARSIAAHVQYACCYWIDHLIGRYSATMAAGTLAPLDQLDSQKLDCFFREKFLHWIEALSLIRNVSSGMLAITNLQLQIPVGLHPLST